ncbi:MAG: hypothetical protein H0W64_07820 [Gammaproteobacteria bacterium]|nr:hypothetical protein [Gammaproteobacteria bacterium]
MIKKWMNVFIPMIATTCLFGCVTPNKTLYVQPSHQNQRVTVQTKSYLNQGKRFFEEGFYKKAMRELLPLACGCEANAEAQYAVGYMYYYGYGVAQDTDVGYFWISLSAAQGFVPAINAERLMAKPENAMPSKKAIKRYGR